GFLTVVLAVWVWLADTPLVVRRLGIAAVGAVIAQGLLGGVTGLFFLPPAVSTAHAGLAEIFFCITVSIALVTSPGWRAQASPLSDHGLRRVATLTAALVYCQILVGATMRHTGAGLAIPDFPWMFGHALPDHWSRAIAVHFAHRVGALIVVTTGLSMAGYIQRWHRGRAELTGPAHLLALLLVVQPTLGAATVLSGLQPWINSAHVVVGASVLATSLVIALRSWQARFSTEPAIDAAPPLTALAVSD